METILEEMKTKPENFNVKSNMLWLVLRTFKSHIAFVVIWGLIAEIIAITNLFLSSLFVRWLEERGPVWEGYLYAFLF